MCKVLAPAKNDRLCLLKTFPEISVFTQSFDVCEHFYSSIETISSIFGNRSTTTSFNYSRNSFFFRKNEANFVPCYMLESLKTIPRKHIFTKTNIFFKALKMVDSNDTKSVRTISKYMHMAREW